MVWERLERNLLVWRTLQETLVVSGTQSSEWMVCVVKDSEASWVWGTREFGHFALGKECLALWREGILFGS